MTSVSRRYAEWAALLEPGDVPAEVREAAGLHALDAVGCILAAVGTRAAGGFAAITERRGGAEEASIAGVTRRVPAASAAAANGALCHALDFDDTHPASICHVSTVVVPAAMAVAEASGANGRALVTALVVANELVTRLGMGGHERFHARGFHPTAVCGVFGAAAAASRLVSFGPRETTHALGIAGSFAGGLFEYLADGSETKPLHAGRAAEGGVTAMELAANGAEGPASVVEGRFGLFAAFTGEMPDDPSSLLDGLGERWETLQMAFKAYPACHYVHAAIDAAARAAEGLDPGSIEEIIAEVPQAAVEIVLEPREAKAHPQSAVDARFSLPFVVAARIARGPVDAKTFTDEARTDPAIVELARRVRYEVRPFAEGFPAAMRIRARGTGERRAEVLHPRGAPGNPMAREDVLAKFRASARLCLDEGDVEALERALLGLEAAADLSEVVAPFRRARPTV